MTQSPTPRGVRWLRFMGGCLLTVWIATAAWHGVKPLPPGLHVTSLSARMLDSQVEFLDPTSALDTSLARMLSAVDRAEQLIVVDQSPLGTALAQRVLTRRYRRPHLKVIVLTDPAGPLEGGTPPPYLESLERAGVVVVRTRLERLRDPNPFYGSVWRLTVGWWSDPFEENSRPGSSRVRLRRWNLKADQRQLLVADDGMGGWLSVVGCSGAPAGGAGIVLRGRLARELVASELRVATWSVDDDRLPRDLPPEVRGAGSIDARVLTEGAIRTSLLDALSTAGSGDAVKIATATLAERTVIDGLLAAVQRGARLELLLDEAAEPGRSGWPNEQVAAELLRGGGRVDIHWRSARDDAERLDLAMIEHRGDVWLSSGSAALTRRALDDLNLEANVELRMSAGATPARAASRAFARVWARGIVRAPTSLAPWDDWRYRLAETLGFAAY